MKWFQDQLKKRSRIYILPTKMGGYLNGLIFLMFLLSVGYSNNLLLIFTLFLFGLNLMWVIQTHFHLHALKLASVLVQDAFAGEKAHVNVRFSKTPALPHSWEITLLGEQSFIVLHEQIEVPIRGVLKFDYIKVKTRMPFGLYFAWIYFPIKAKSWVYPAKPPEVPPLTINLMMEEGDLSGLRRGPHDVWNLSRYQGEESRKISWKHYARTGDLIVKEGEDPSKALVHFVLLRAPQYKEQFLSVMCGQMVHCSLHDMSFSLDVPGKKRLMGHSNKHLVDCLRELAEC